MTKRVLGTVLISLWVWAPLVAQDEFPSLDQSVSSNDEILRRLNRLEALVGHSSIGSDEAPAQQSLDEETIVDKALQLTGATNLVEAVEYPIVNLTGFFQADVGWVNQDAASLSAVGDAEDGTHFRRARLAAVGNVAPNVSYMLEMDFAFPGRPSFMDVWGELHDTPFHNVRFGQYRQPFGLDGLTSVKDLTFLERNLAFAFLPFRQTGVMSYGHSEEMDMSWWISGFRAPVDVFGNNTGDNGGYGMAARLTAVVLDDGKGGIVHVGGAYSFIEPSTGTVQYRNQPEFFVSDEILGSTPFFVDTMSIATDRVNLYAGEIAATSGRWHAQGEIVYAAVDRSGASTATFSGVSVQSGWLLLGGHRPYDRKNAVLGRVVPVYIDGFNHAWEIAARYSYLDLNDGGINGRQLSDVTAGFNWYLNQFTKFQFNYVHAFLKTAGAGDSDADIVAFRAQIDF
ncbi:MAG: porin [Planctomycetaceae bacterium]|nr:porin [Planctomycetaceae bacterium]